MEIRQLRYAVLLAECLHFGRAAERAHITQSAFSQQIARLEREVGSALFDRRSNRVSITPAGQLLVQHAGRVLDGLSDLQSEVGSLVRAQNGQLCIGIFGAAAGELTPLLISSYRRAFPDVDLRFRDLSMAGQIAELRDGTVDLAIVHIPVEDSEIVVHPLFAEPRLAALPADHRLADAADLTVTQLLDEPFVTAGPETPRAWRSFWSCDDLGREQRPARAYMNSVAEGLAAVAFLGVVDTLPATATRFHRYPGVTYVPLRDASFATVAVARRRTDSRAIVHRFCDVAIEVARRFRSVVPAAVTPTAR